MGAVPWRSAIDFCALAVAFYLLLRWSRGARALRLGIAIVGLRVSAFLATQLDLPITSSLLEAASIVALLALILIFQPELRRALMRLDIAGRARSSAVGSAAAAVSAAAWTLARSRCGALMVMERQDAIAELVSPGVTLNAIVSADLLVAVFQKGSPLHDGAVLLDGETVRQAGGILPLTQRASVPHEYGTRHRAGMGLADRSDALVLVVSEERGEITLMSAGRIRTVASEAELLVALTGGLSERQAATHLHALRPANVRLIAAAMSLALAVWSAAFLFPGRSVRLQTVPLEFTDVPAGLTIADQSTEVVQVRFRGTEFVFQTAGLQRVVARCDLGAAHTGTNVIPLSSAIVDVPFGLHVEGVVPKQVSVRLATVPSPRITR
jgi:diadenylate cyclase